MASHNPAAGVLLELDGRRRVTLGRLAGHDRYLARVMANGSILLEPAVVLTAEEAAVLADPEFVATMRAAIADSEAGRVTRYDPATFPAGDDEQEAP